MARRIGEPPTVRDHTAGEEFSLGARLLEAAQQVEGFARMGPLLPVGQLGVGCSGRIRRLMGRPEDVHRLEEFGLRPGTSIEMFRPGNPCILRLDGHKVCFRADDGLEILVTPSDAPPG